MRLSAQGMKVVNALAEGRCFRRTAEGWTSGALRAPISLVDDLVRAGRVRTEADALVLARSGPTTAPRPARMLVERAVPRDGDDDPATPRARRTATVNLLESPLGWLRARDLIDRRQYDAGERLRGDWTMAGLGPRVTMRWDAAPTARGPRGPDAPLDPTLAGIAAKRRFDGAIAAAGKGLTDVLWRVVCSGEGLAAAEAALGWPKRSGKLVLLMALDRVADYYGIQ